MTTVEVASFAVTVGLGVIAIVLAVFSIVLSWKFNDRSTDSLDKVGSLTTEIRSLIDATVVQQKDFSSRMLDSILEKGPYGRDRAVVSIDKDTRALEEIVRHQLEETEKRIANEVESKIRSFVLTNKTDPIAIQQVLASIRAEIKSLASQAATTASSSALVSESMKKKLMEWKDLPSHYQVIAAIVKENVTSEEQLRKHMSKYNIPEPIKHGLDNLLQAGILCGTLESFEISPQFKTFLPDWVNRNWSTINKIIGIMSAADLSEKGPVKKSIKEETKMIADGLEF